MQKVMIDLETMGVKPGYVVLSIGAVVFDEDGPVEGEDYEFHCRLDTSVQHAVGLRTDPDTALWWMGQSDDARKALLGMQPLAVQPTLGSFADWLEWVVGEDVDRNDDDTLKVEVWGNGANFDPPMLRELYEAVGVKCPWAWYNERCYRTERKTLKRLLKAFGLSDEDPEREGTHHDALADAKHQATVLATLESLLVNHGA